MSADQSPSSGYNVERPSSDSRLSLPSVHRSSVHPTTNSTIAYTAVPSFTEQPSIAIHQYQSPGMFHGANNFTIQGSTLIENTSDTFMKEFLPHTIIGAEYDSSDRHPPPRCHPGTRLKVLERCKAFVAQCNDQEKMRWVVGPAGVGKSAIMQMVAEETPADASVFLSVNGRRDGTKTFNTIAYQFAAKYETYRQFISQEISHDPTLLRKALPAQFQKFIVNPFINQRLFSPPDRFLVIIDGLDECDNPSTQRELLQLISDFCLSYPNSPIVWFIASRPEPHITSFFDDAKVASVYSKEEIEIDSNEACEDVQRYLRAGLNDIKNVYLNLKRKREWPSEFQCTKIATAAGGLFAYASTVVRYIGDADYGDPVSQLDDVLVAIDAGPKGDIMGRNNPLAQLDALYERIMSKIPESVMVNTRKLLLVSASYEKYRYCTFRAQCNMLGLTEDAAYSAVRHLHAVMKIPARDEADAEDLTCFHKSFYDFLFDFNRSGFSRNIDDEAMLLMVQSSLRIIEQVPDDFDGMDNSKSIICFHYGLLINGPGLCDDISLSWPDDECPQYPDYGIRFDLYSITIASLCDIHPSFWTMSSLRAVTTRFTVPDVLFPFYSVLSSVFDRFRPDFMRLGKLKRVPLWALDYAAICGLISFRFTSPVGKDAETSNPWNLTCPHVKFECEGVEGSQQLRGWTTSFQRSLNDPRDAAICAEFPRFSVQAGKDSHWDVLGSDCAPKCLECCRRLARQFITNPDRLATVFVDSTEMCYVELLFVDPDDGVSQWRYRFLHSGLPVYVD